MVAKRAPYFSKFWLESWNGIYGSAIVQLLSKKARSFCRVEPLLGKCTRVEPVKTETLEGEEKESRKPVVANPPQKL